MAAATNVERNFGVGIIVNVMKTLTASVVAAMLVAGPVVAQESPSAGPSGGDTATWASMPVGSYVMIGGFIFLVTITGLVLADDDDKAKTPTPTPTPSPTTTTTTTSTS